MAGNNPKIIQTITTLETEQGIVQYREHHKPILSTGKDVSDRIEMVVSAVKLVYTLCSSVDSSKSAVGSLFVIQGYQARPVDGALDRKSRALFSGARVTTTLRNDDVSLHITCPSSDPIFSSVYD